MNERTETNEQRGQERRTDRRVSRTRRQLRDALLALIIEHGYDSVTIEQITQRADLGRTTFYLHYRDKEELLIESIDSIAQELLVQVVPLPKPGQMGEDDAPRDPAQAATLLVFRHAAQNSLLYRVILRGEGALKANTRFHEIIQSSVREYVEELNRSAPDFQPMVPLEVFSSYFAAALLGLVTWWLERDMPYSPEEMSEYFRRMFFRGARGALIPNEVTP
ncbi:MAG: TetR/AcrR family transcriptional regulator [Anaerolineae bacterium]|jgi:AcrR family transcriptional regulator|nr:TetR/AcrR family transcriptional regulator [Anaerolineae bacterium]